MAAKRARYTREEHPDGVAGRLGSGPRSSVHPQLMEAIRKHLASQSELTALLVRAGTRALRARATVLRKEIEQSPMTALQLRQRSQWPQQVPTSVLLLIVERCSYPGLPHCMMTSTALRDLIASQLHETIPHLRVPRDMPSVQAAIERAPAGGLIAVHEGVYNERLSVNRCVHIRGAGKADNIDPEADHQQSWQRLQQPK